MECMQPKINVEVRCSCPGNDKLETVAQDVLKSSPLNTKIILIETSMCIPGVISQTR